jgi:rare lipoprotein A
MYAMTAAHKTLPLPAYAEVTNLRNGRRSWCASTIAGHSSAIASSISRTPPRAKLDMLLQGTAPVEVRVITPGITPAPVGAAPLPAPRHRRPGHGGERTGR